MKLWRVFLRQLASPFDALLIGVAVVAVLLHQGSDAAIVLIVVGASVLLGTHNEYRAERTIDALRSRISRCANVVRNGNVVRIDVAELVIGDVVLLRIGDIAPADISFKGFSSLGESLRNDVVPIPGIVLWTFCTGAHDYR